MTTHELIAQSEDLRHRRLYKCAMLHKRAETPAGTTPPKPEDKKGFDFSKIPPEAWGALLGLAGGAGIGALSAGPEKRGKGALWGAGIGGALGAGAGHATRYEPVQKALATAGSKVAIPAEWTLAKAVDLLEKGGEGAEAARKWLAEKGYKMERFSKGQSTELPEGGL